MDAALPENNLANVLTSSSAAVIQAKVEPGRDIKAYYILDVLLLLLLLGRFFARWVEEVVCYRLEEASHAGIRNRELEGAHVLLHSQDHDVDAAGIVSTKRVAET